MGTGCTFHRPKKYQLIWREISQTKPVSNAQGRFQLIKFFFGFALLVPKLSFPRLGDWLWMIGSDGLINMLTRWNLGGR